MKSNYISGFVKRGGVFVLLSTAFVKLSSAILSIIVVRILSKENYGILSYVLSVYSIAIVIAGFGGNYSLLRYGAIVKSFLQKYSHYKYTLRNGTYLCLIVTFAIILYSFLPIGVKNTSPYLLLTSIIIIPFFRLETLRSLFRILDLNQIYSKLNTYNSIIMLILVILGTYLGDIYGYLIGIGLSSLIAFLIFDKLNIRISNPKIDVSKNDYWGYGLNTSISAIANQIIFSVAPLLMGILMVSEAEIAQFKVATIIPFNLLTLPGIIMITDFNYLAKNYDDKIIIKQYYHNYLKTVIPISLIVFSILIYYSNYVIEFLFGAEYLSCVNIYILFMIATFITYIFRNPLGNILLAVGKAKWNGYNTYFFCLFYIFFTLVFYNILGIYSAVYGLFLTFILSGFVSLALYYKYLKQLK